MVVLTALRIQTLVTQLQLCEANRSTLSSVLPFLSLTCSPTAISQGPGDPKSDHHSASEWGHIGENKDTSIQALHAAIPSVPLGLSGTFPGRELVLPENI